MFCWSGGPIHTRLKTPFSHDVYYVDIGVWYKWRLVSRVTWIGETMSHIGVWYKWRLVSRVTWIGETMSQRIIQVLVDYTRIVRNVNPKISTIVQYSELFFPDTDVPLSSSKKKTQNFKKNLVNSFVWKLDGHFSELNATTAYND